MTTPPAATLRAAAEAMRERAEAAGEVWGVNRWKAYQAATPYDRGVHTADLDRRYVGTDDEHGSILLSSPWDEGQVVEHIASWHPAVALAVADWLEQVATGWEDRAADFAQGGRFAGLGTWEPPEQHPALTVARTYLGGETQ